MSAISLKSITGITSITTPAAPDNQITLHTLPNTVERVRITSGGNVGINSTIPRSKLHVANGGSHYNPGNPTGLGAGAVASLESSGDVALQFLSSTTTDNFIYFGDTSSATTGSIQYDHNVNALLFNVNGGTERLRIDSNGNIQLGSAANPGNALRYFDVYNLNTGTSAGSIIRLITTKSDGSSTTSADIVKYKTGGLVINNNEVLGTTGFISFGTGTAGGSITERLRITSAGQVQINGDGGSAALTLGASQDFKMYHDAGGPTIFSDGGNQGLKLQIKELILTEYTGVTERFRIKSNGQVDIASNNYNSGHANTKLRVGTESGSTEATAVIGSADQDVPALTITNWDGSATTNKNVIRFDNSGRGTYEIGGVGGTNAFAITVDSSERARIDSNGKVGINSATPQFEMDLMAPSGSTNTTLSIKGRGTGYGQLRINGGASENYITSVSDPLAIYVGSGGQKAKFDTSGNFLIGAGGADHYLHIKQAATTTYAKIETTHSSSTYTGINLRSPTLNFQIWNQGPGATGYSGSNSVVFWQAAATGPYAFYHGNDERLRIDSSGKVGINETNPQNSLHISGSAPAIRFADTDANGSAFSIIEDNNGLLKLRNDAGNAGTGSGISFEVDGSGKVLITSDGNVLINTQTKSTAQADAPLQIVTGSNGNTVSLRARSADNAYAYINFQDNAGSKTAAEIHMFRNSQNGGQLIFGTCVNNATFPTERLRITSTGNLEKINGGSYFAYNSNGYYAKQDNYDNNGGKSYWYDGGSGNNNIVASIDGQTGNIMSKGNIRIFTAGKGIDFSSQTNEGSTSQSALLADYEEGVWTPTNSIGMTLTVNNGAHYIKIGKQVTVWFDVTLTGNPDSAQCSAIQNLPYVSKSSNTYYGQSNSVWYSNTGDAKKDYDDDNTLIYVSNNSTTINIWNITGGHIRVRSWSNGRRFRGTVTYLAKN